MKCSKCKELKSRADFSTDKTAADDLKFECKQCIRKRTTENPIYAEQHSRHNKIRYQENLEYNREWRGNYYYEHKEDYKANNAKRRAQKLNATPKWANLNEIKEFYLQCPQGYEVDHIIPLQGDIVSGLHVLNNLQYLTVSDNRSKSNKFNIEGVS